MKKLILMIVALVAVGCANNAEAQCLNCQTRMTVTTPVVRSTPVTTMVETEVTETHYEPVTTTRTVMVPQTTYSQSVEYVQTDVVPVRARIRPLRAFRWDCLASALNAYQSCAVQKRLARRAARLAW